jgi:3-deoxy-manno-octulosonate cytidylyltransferase (CMP-KDO synthetase)
MEELVVVIPARIGSTRLPRKPLVELCGKPLIVRVAEGVRRFTDRVLIATDSAEVLELCRRFGFKGVLTPSELPSGTDRVYWGLREAKLRPKFVINVQGDEPFITEEHLSLLLKALREGAEYATLAVPFKSLEEVNNPARVKVVTDAKGFALYFSRSPIPYPREGELPPSAYLKHIGVYGFTYSSLERFVKLPKGRLEEIEKLEQLRILESGGKIKVELTQRELLGIDTPEDLKRAEKILKGEG